MKFITRRDPWLSIVIWACVILMVFAGLSPFFNEGIGPIGGMILLILCLACAGFIAWLWVATSYVINDSELFIRTGPFKKSISFDSVKKAKPIRSWMSSMATSSRRVEIHYGSYDFVHVSPLDQEAFLMELRMRCPHVIVETGS
ncbi:PH domain-containing protein [Paenibacillus nasutitermitis]|uniref:Uncharacterized protein YyaB-like PH domain-containing protein n=1 Tax=Paenibacillus nasutitermitis TaxID=1652958 RepID=A0A916ZE36_9BACL|nr:PH domain-containing protein [Paenibacillus nasutitermitis]GGD89046.1 hypothetical protein GCM10010911_54550 [Paenibacillus nasutitermitis]